VYPSLLAWALSMVGCSSTPTEELLSITFGDGPAAPPVEVDTLCGNGGCQTSAELAANLSFEDDGTVGDDAVVEILQYRVDYTMGGFVDEVPYYSGATSVVVAKGASTIFQVRVAGDRQRDFFASRLGSGEVNGEGRLTLAGYDEFDEIVLVFADFDIAFGDFEVGGEGSGDSSGDSGGAGGGT
jgi:hypothetical protein